MGECEKEKGDARKSHRPKLQKQRVSWPPMWYFAGEDGCATLGAHGPVRAMSPALIVPLVGSYMQPGP